MSVNTALVTGCPRSGTSIIGECVAQAPGARYLFEPPALRNCYPHELAEWFRASPPGRRVIKAPFLVYRAQELLSLVPDLSIIVVEREWRDTVASLWAGRQREAERGHRPWELERCLDHVKWARRAVHPLRGDPRVQFAPFEQFVLWPGTYVESTWEWLGWDRPRDSAAVIRVQDSVSNRTEGYHAQGQSAHYVPHQSRIGRWKELPEPQRSRLEEMTWES